jgi:pimeloyl-ACP methyl ester carboxylesterase
VSTALTPTEHEVHVAGLRIKSMRAGSGSPLLVLHHSTGSIGWSPFYERLAEHHEVDVPDLPGYGQSEMPEWARDPRDLAVLMLHYLRNRRLEDATVVGLGFGGFIGAEMASMDPDAMAQLVLVGAPGLRPEEGEIHDQMLTEHTEYVKMGFRDEETATRHLGEEIDKNVTALWQFNRVMTARVSWRPYMWDGRLPHLLPEITTPTLLVYGEADRIVPRAVAQQYERGLPNARLEIVPGAGHLVEIEEPDTVAGLVRAHVEEREPATT